MLCVDDDQRLLPRVVPVNAHPLEPRRLGASDHPPEAQRRDGDRAHQKAGDQPCGWRPLRNFLRAQATIENLVDFGDHQIFEEVTTYPAILTMKRGAAPKDHQISFWKIEDMPKSNFRAAFEEFRSDYPQNVLTEESWEFEDPALYALRRKVTKGHKTLKQIYGSPACGIKTGYNDAFIIDSITREELISKDQTSSDIIFPYVVGSDIQKWRLETQSKYIINATKGRTKIENFPAILEYLTPHKGRLESRATKQQWFELQQDQFKYQELFRSHKLIFPDISQGPKFLMHDAEVLLDMTAFAINGDPFLQSLLNSKIYWFILLGSTNPLRGGVWRLRLKSQYVEPLPIPKSNDAQKTELASLAEATQTAAEERYKLQENLCRRIPDLCPDDREPKLTTKLKEWWNLPDFKAFQAEVKKCFKSEIPLRDRTEWEDWMNKDRAEINRLSAQIRGHEDAINTIVYELFGLNDEEIKLLEANI